MAKKKAKSAAAERNLVKLNQMIDKFCEGLEKASELILCLRTDVRGVRERLKSKKRRKQLSETASSLLVLMSVMLTLTAMIDLLATDLLKELEAKPRHGEA